MPACLMTSLRRLLIGSRRGRILKKSESDRQPALDTMTAFDLLEILRVRPFEPSRIYASDGRSYDVRHPDQALVLLNRVILPLPSTLEVSERSEQLSLSHIVRVEVLSSPVGPASGPVDETAK